MGSDSEKQLTEKEQEKAALKAREAEISAKETEANKDRSGKGTRVFFGMTRGRNPQMISYENWDEAKPETLPTTLSEFMDLRKVTDEKDIVRLLTRLQSLLMQRGRKRFRRTSAPSFATTLSVLEFLSRMPFLSSNRHISLRRRRSNTLHV